MHNSKALYAIDGFVNMFFLVRKLIGIHTGIGREIIMHYVILATLATAVFMSSGLWAAENKVNGTPEQVRIGRLESREAITYYEERCPGLTCGKNKLTGEYYAFKTALDISDCIFDPELQQRSTGYYSHFAKLYASQQQRKKH